MTKHFSFAALASGIAIAVTTLTVWACTKDKTPTPIETCDPNKIYFRNDILPLINSNCAKSGCHDPITREEGYNFTTYAGIMQIVKRGDPSDSKLMEVITSTKPDDLMPPPPNPTLTPAQIDMVRRWIAAGAVDQYCVSDSTSCGITDVSYKNNIAPAVSANCIGCHNPTNLSGGIDLSDYNGVKSVASTGKLYHAVAQDGQATPMPPNQKLSSCSISQIKTWVDAGAKNN